MLTKFFIAARRSPQGASRLAKPRGFTLIEMLVSTAIFAIVMVIALGALLAMSESDRRAQAIKSVVDNLNFALDSMSRSIRTGTSYHCGSLSGGDCQSGGQPFYFLDSNGRTVGYQFDNSTSLCGQVGTTGCIERSIDGGATWLPITAPEAVIQNVKFYLVGSTAGDTLQPKLTIELSGYVQSSANQKTSFNLQTSVTQRVYDQ